MGPPSPRLWESGNPAGFAGFPSGGEKWFVLFHAASFPQPRRQQQLVPLIPQGLTNEEIASHLNLSEQTVKNHVYGIMRRMGANDRLQVIDQTRFWRGTPITSGSRFTQPRPRRSGFGATSDPDNPQGVQCAAKRPSFCDHACHVPSADGSPANPAIGS